ncbi:MAG: single-stranded-DNA-specific exonuclease RecJ [Bacillota bacterium]|nr:single-stranded-DNA-specific exonuclease RecJ [Bacillota bacterium]MDD4707886.1 single-stranded-DNA-specific exonuclease RecJ [Bacillota bacterium]
MFHNKKWTCDNPDGAKVRELAGAMDITPILAAALVNRGIETVREGERFLHPRLDHLFDPFLMPDMENSVERIILALDRGERICIYGDYDVDGITSVSFFMRVLKAAGADAYFYIPSRMEEGYGLNAKAVREIQKSGTGLIITVDCGIASYDEVELCNQCGMDVIVTDHHLCQDRLPPALGVINPRRSDSEYPFSDLAGIGVAYKLCTAFETAMQKRGTPIGQTGDTTVCESMLDLVALGTVADIVPIIGENRVLASLGLKQMAHSTNTGLRALIKVAGIAGGQISTGQVAFGLAPRLNAAGRLADAKKGVRLLLEEDRETALLLAKEMDAQNRERQAVESEIFEQAVELADKRAGDSLLVLASEGWHPGVIGIAASRIVERYNKPAVLFHIDGDEARGSARSIPGLDLYRLLLKCRHYYKRFGGHRQAAGLTLETDNLEEFTREINSITREALEGLETRSIINADADLTGICITVEDAEALELLEPCGCGNPSPLFVKRHIEVKSAKRVGKQRNHLKLMASEGDVRLDCIAFRWREDGWPAAGQEPDIVFSPRVNNWLGSKGLQLVLRDIKDLSKEETFLKGWYKSLMGMYDRDVALPEAGVILSDLEIQRVGCWLPLVRDLFSKSTGNLLLLNGYKGVLKAVSMLSMYPNTEVVFGRLEGYSEDKNFVVVQPSSFEKIKECKGDMYFLAWSVLPAQFRAIADMRNNRRVMLVDEGARCLKDEFLDILPDREVLAAVYRMTKRKEGLNLDEMIRLIMKRGINPAKTLLAVEGLKSADLINERDCGLFLLPAPENKIKLHDISAFNMVRFMASAAGDCFEAVKKCIFDI